MKRVTLYVRNSDDDKQEGSVERQLDLCRAYCKRKGYLIVEEYIDEGRRGYDKQRPELNRMIADAEAGRFTAIVIDEDSRLSRDDNIDFSRYFAGPLRDAGVEVESVARGGALDWNDLSGSLMQHIEQHKASSEIRQLSRRTISGMMRLAKDGLIHCGKPPFGMRRDGDKLAPGSEREVEIVRWIFEAYAGGKTLRAIRDELYRRGAKSPSGCEMWSAQSIRDLLKNRVYAGDYVYNKESRGRFHKMENGVPVPIRRRVNYAENPVEDWIIRTNDHPAIVGREMFDTVQSMLRVNATRTTPRREHGFIFAKLLRCPCGAHMRGYVAANGSRMYRCGKFCEYGSGEGGCRPNTVREDVLLDAVIDAVQKQLLNPERLAELRKAMRDEAGSERSRQRLVALQKEIDKLAADIKRGTGRLLLVDDEDVAELKETLRGWKQIWQSRSAELEKMESADPTGDIEKIIKHVERNLWEIRKAIEKDNIDLLRDVMRATVVRADLCIAVEKRPQRDRYKLTGGTVTLYNGEAAVLQQDTLVNDGNPHLTSRVCNCVCKTLTIPLLPVA